MIFQEWEKNLYEKVGSYKGTYYFEGGAYKIDRTSFGEISSAFNILKAWGDVLERLRQSKDIYSVFNIGIGDGTECVIPLSRIDGARYFGTNVNTPPHFRKDIRNFPNFTYIDNFVLEQAEIEPYKHKIDLVLSSRVIEWSHDARLWMRQVYRLLKPGGIAIIFTTPVLQRTSGHPTAIEVAKAAGFKYGYAQTQGGKDIYADITKLILYKPLENGQKEFPEWLKDMRLQTELTSIAELS